MVYTIKLKIGMLYHINNIFQNTVFQIYVNVSLMETFSVNGSRLFQWKSLLLVKTNSFIVEAIPFSGNHSFQQKPFLLVEAIPFSRSHSFQQKPFLLVEAIPFSGNDSFQWKPFLLVEAIPFSGSHSVQWKPLLLVQTIPFSGSHQFQ